MRSAGSILVSIHRNRTHIGQVAGPVHLHTGPLQELGDAGAEYNATAFGARTEQVVFVVDYIGIWCADVDDAGGERREGRWFVTVPAGRSAATPGGIVSSG